MSISKFSYRFCENYEYNEQRPWMDVEHAEILYGPSRIGNYMFSECKKLKTVVIPDSVTEIGDYAFFGCESLEYVVLPSHLLTIGDAAFAKSGIRSLVIPKTVEVIEKLAFSECGQLHHVYIPRLNAYIDEHAFLDSNDAVICTTMASLSLRNYTKHSNNADIKKLNVDTFNLCVKSQLIIIYTLLNM